MGNKRREGRIHAQEPWGWVVATLVGGNMKCGIFSPTMIVDYLHHAILDHIIDEIT